MPSSIYGAPDPTTGTYTIPAFMGVDPATNTAQYAFNSPITPTTGSLNGGMFSGGTLGNIATGLGMGLFTSILGKTIGGFLDKPVWGTQAEADALIAEWLKNNPLDPYGNSRERTAVEAPSAPGYVQDEQGYYRNTNDPTDQGYYVISGNTPIKVTPPMVPVPKPTTGAAATGGASSGGSAGSNQPTFGAEGGDMNAPVDMDGGFEDIFNIDVDLTGDIGGLNPGTGNGPTIIDQPPTEERSDDEWLVIIRDWLNRFPNATPEQIEAAIVSENVPRGLADQVLGEQTAPTGPVEAPTSPVAPTPVPTQPTTPQVPPTSPTEPSTGTNGTGGGTGGTGTGTGGTGTGTGLFGTGPTATSDLVFPELFKLKKDFTMIDNLLSYRPGGMLR
jgi:hypothetical protein